MRITLDIGMNQIQNLLHQKLKVGKLWCRWILLKKELHIEWCRKKIQSGTSNLIWNFVKEDETQIYCYGPENKVKRLNRSFKSNLSLLIFEKKKNTVLLLR